MADEEEVFEHTHKKKGIVPTSDEEMELCDDIVKGVSISQSFFFSFEFLFKFLMTMKCGFY